jgi:uncharacterized protein
MALSIYDAFVPSARQIVAASIGLIDKAEAHCGEQGLAPAELIEARLAPDMFGLPFQVHSVAGHTAGAIAGVKAGRFSPSGAGGEPSFATLRAELAAAEAALAGLDPAELETYAGKPVIFALGSMEMPFTAENFLLSFSQPNFYFHAATLYDILRHKGVKLGKRDFMGMPRVGL